MIKPEEMRFFIEEFRRNDRYYWDACQIQIAGIEDGRGRSMSSEERETVEYIYAKAWWAGYEA